MKVQCQNCGHYVLVNGFGRRPLNIPVTEVCDTLQRHHNIRAAATKLGCSRGYIYKVLKENGLTVKDFVDSARQRKSKRKEN